MDNLKRSIYARKGKTPFLKSLLKSTYNGDTDVPKQKHVQKIFQALKGHDMSTNKQQAFNQLTQRLMDGHWSSVLKAELILHRSIQQLGRSHSSILSSIDLPMSNFHDPSEKGSAHNKLIQDYFKYIRASAFNHTQKDSVMVLNASDRTRAIEQFSNEKLLAEIENMVGQLEQLVGLSPSFHQAIRNYQLKITQAAAYWVLKDSNGLYKSVAIALDRLVDRFYSLGKKLATKSLKLYSKFETCTRKLSHFFEIAHYLPFSGLSPPTFVNRPKQVVAQMEFYVQHQADQQQKRPEPQTEIQTAKQKKEFSTQPTRKENKIDSSQNQIDLIFDLDASPNELPAEKSQSVNMQSMTPMMTGMGAFSNMMPGMVPMNPMMTGMMPMNPMMTGMVPMNPMMTGMIPMNSMMTGMIPMMQNTSQGDSNPFAGFQFQNNTSGQRNSIGGSNPFQTEQTPFQKQSSNPYQNNNPFEF